MFFCIIFYLMLIIYWEEIMNIDIRKSIKDNFKDSNNEDIFESIESAVKDGEEITLPGMGVFFEILWVNSNEEFRNNIIDIIKNNI